MRLHAYAQLHRTLYAGTQTGVGKHIDQMVPRLARADGVDLRVLADRGALTGGEIPKESSLHGLPCAGLPARRWLEAAWDIVNAPKVERWAGPADWVYSPGEAYVATSGRLAVTVHCVNWFERELSWYNEPGT